MICGGTSEAKEMTQEVIDVCHKVKADVETKAGTKFDVFEPKSFKSQVSTEYWFFFAEYNWFYKSMFQVVAGTNFFVKVHVGDNKHVHLRIYQDLQQNISLHGHQVDKSLEDEIEYFQ